MTNDAIATPRALLGSMRKQALARTRSIALSVPNYDGAVVVKYRAITVDEVNKANKSVEKLPKPIQPYKAALKLLANACVGVYAKNADGNFESVLGADEPVPTFADEELAIALVDGKRDELPERLTAGDTVSLLYVTELDVIMTADALSDASGARKIEAEEDFLES